MVTEVSLGKGGIFQNSLTPYKNLYEFKVTKINRNDKDYKIYADK